MTDIIAGHCNQGNPGIGDSCVPEGGGCDVIELGDDGDTDPGCSVVVDSAASCS